jgi:alkylated DNA repair dioxygenase AlkB
VLQGHLLGTAPIGVAEWAPVARHHLDDASWVDHAPGWVTGADDLFDAVCDGVPWRQRTGVVMYDRIVDEPRLSWWGAGTQPIRQLDAIGAALEARYARPLPLVSANLYRSERDSVAWHRDKVGAKRDDCIVAIVSLGATRPFLVRPHAKRGASHRFDLMAGDLIVLGGACQRDWEHHVPKLSRASGPRISVMWRE